MPYHSFIFACMRINWKQIANTFRINALTKWTSHYSSISGPTMDYLLVVSLLKNFFVSFWIWKLFYLFNRGYHGVCLYHRACELTTYTALYHICQKILPKCYDAGKSPQHKNSPFRLIYIINKKPRTKLMHTKPVSSLFDLPGTKILWKKDVCDMDDSFARNHWRLLHTKLYAEKSAEWNVWNVIALLKESISVELIDFVCASVCAGQNANFSRYQKLLAFFFFVDSIFICHGL